MEAKEMETKTDLYRTTYHRDHSITYWDVYSQTWRRTYQHPSDQVMASLSEAERQRITRHLSTSQEG